MGEGDTLVNAVIGGIAAVVLSFVPFSPVLGGAVAGYLQGGTRSEGMRVGAMSGIVAAIPLLLVAAVFLLITAVAVPAVEPGMGLGVVAFLVLVLAGLAVGGLYTVGLGALGGWIGNYVKYDTDVLE